MFHSHQVSHVVELPEGQEGVQVGLVLGRDGVGQGGVDLLLVGAGLVKVKADLPALVTCTECHSGGQTLRGFLTLKSLPVVGLLDHVEALEPGPELGPHPTQVLEEKVCGVEEERVEEGDGDAAVDEGGGGGVGVHADQGEVLAVVVVFQLTAIPPSLGQPLLVELGNPLDGPVRPLHPLGVPQAAGLVAQPEQAAVSARETLMWGKGANRALSNLKPATNCQLFTRTVVTLLWQSAARRSCWRS